MTTTSRTTRGPGDKPVTTAMSRPAFAVHDGDTLESVLRAFTLTGFRHLAVIDNAGRCAGLISDRTVCAAWVRDPMMFDRLTAIQIMDEVAPIVDEHATVRWAAQVMHMCGTDAVVVVDAAGRPRLACAPPVAGQIPPRTGEIPGGEAGTGRRCPLESLN